MRPRVGDEGQVDVGHKHGLADWVAWAVTEAFASAVLASVFLVVVDWHAYGYSPAGVAWGLAVDDVLGRRAPATHRPCLDRPEVDPAVQTRSDEEDAPPPPVLWSRRTMLFVGWLASMTAMIWLLGFAIAGAVGALLFTSAARERLWVRLAHAGSLFAFVWFLDNVLLLPFPRAALPGILGM